MGLAVLAAFCLTLGVYVFTMPVNITFEDAGLFQMICHEGGIGHPPGYPLFVLSCQAFVGLPLFDTGVFAGNLLSALYAAAAMGLVVLVGFELTRSLSAGLLLALIYGFSATLWSQAIIIEVYSLQVLLFTAALYLALRFWRDGHEYLLFPMAFVVGLGLSNHWPLQVLSAPALLLLIAGRWSSLIVLLRQPIKIVLLGGLLLLGLVPYLSLLQAAPEYAVFGPIQSLDELLRYVARSAYSDQSPVAGLQDMLRFQWWLLRETAAQFSVFLVPFLLLGLFLSFRKFPLAVSLSLLSLYLGATSLLVLLTGFEFNSLRMAIFRPYPIVAYLAPAIWTVFGLQFCLEGLRNAGRVAPLMVASMVPVVVLLENLPLNNRAGDDFAFHYAEQVFAGVPENSVLLVEGDNGVGLLGYLRYVAGYREDLDLRSWNNLVFPNRLVSPFASDAIQDEARRRFIRQSPHPVYSTVHHSGYPAVNQGVLFHHGDPGGFICDGRLHDYAAQLVDIYLSDTLADGHEREHLFGLLLDLTRQHVGLLLFQEAPLTREVQMLATLQQTFPGKLATLETMVQYPQSEQGKRALSELAETAVSEQPPYLTRQVAAVLQEFRGRIALMAPESQAQAIAFFEKSLALYPADDNTSLCPLRDLYRIQGQKELILQVDQAYEHACR